MTRREILKHLGFAGTISALSAFATNAGERLRRAIPGTEELLPCVGLGTWRTFDVGPGESERSPLLHVLRNFVRKEARIVDTSPMYGKSQKVLGELSDTLSIDSDLFLATKVWTSGETEGKDQMENSMKLLKRKKIDLLQIHNLVDWQTQLKTLRAWRDQGRIRYIGITHYIDGMHSTMETILKSNPIDFIQVNYSLGTRNAERRLLPVAADYGKAVIINRPFEEGALFDRMKNIPFPEWARQEINCQSWAQLFLKFILSNSAVTCTIPATSNPLHLLENVEAATTLLPDEKQRQKMIALLR
jgi:diketogulonate reductase-like aldo/keto reductase